MAAWLHNYCRSVCLAEYVRHIDRRTMLPVPFGVAEQHFAQAQVAGPALPAVQA